MLLRFYFSTIFQSRQGWGGDHLGPPKSPKISKTYFVRELLTLLGHVFKTCQTYQKQLQNLFLYTEKYNESDKHIQNDKFIIQSTPTIATLIFTNPNHSNIFDHFQQLQNFILLYISNIHNSYFVYFIYLVYFIYFVYIIYFVYFVYFVYIIFPASLMW